MNEPIEQKMTLGMPDTSVITPEMRKEALTIIWIALNTLNRLPPPPEVSRKMVKKWPHFKAKKSSQIAEIGLLLHAADDAVIASLRDHWVPLLELAFEFMQAATALGIVAGVHESD